MHCTHPIDILKRPVLSPDGVGLIACTGDDTPRRRPGWIADADTDADADAACTCIYCNILI
jgi:hypothetical protein